MLYCLLLVVAFWFLYRILVVRIGLLIICINRCFYWLNWLYICGICLIRMYLCLLWKNLLLIYVLILSLSNCLNILLNVLNDCILFCPVYMSLNCICLVDMKGCLWVFVLCFCILGKLWEWFCRYLSLLYSFYRSNIFYRRE